MALPLEISCSDVQQLLQTNSEFLFWDCREPVEFQIASVDATKQLPLSELPNRLSELVQDPNRRIVVMCHLGVRSLQAAAWLRQQGIDGAQSMIGGIDAWSIEVDPSVPRY